MDYHTLVSATETWVRAKWPNGFLCPMCSHTTLDNAGLVHLHGVPDSRMPNDGGVIPVIALICPNCGFVLQFSAKAAGISDKTG